MASSASLSADPLVSAPPVRSQSASGDCAGGTFAVEEMDDFHAVADDLHFDVPSPGEKLFHISAPEPKAVWASEAHRANISLSSANELAGRMPRPPPPASALIMTAPRGPRLSRKLSASSRLVAASVPGMVGTPAAFALAEPGPCPRRSREPPPMVRRRSARRRGRRRRNQRSPRETRSQGARRRIRLQSLGHELARVQVGRGPRALQRPRLIRLPRV